MSGTDSDSGLFDGVEDSTREPLTGDEYLAPQTGGLKAMLRGVVRQWWRDLTYREWHAFIVGFVPWFLFLVTGRPLLLGAAVGILLVCLGYLKLPNPALRAIVREPWYCLAGGTLGWMVGATVLAWTRLVAVVGGVIG